MNCCLQKYTRSTYQFTYMLYTIYFKTNSKIQKLSKSNKYIKRYILLQNNFIILFTLFSIGDSLEFKATQEARLI